MIGWKTLTSRGGLARQVLTMKPDVKFAIKRLNYPIREDKLLVGHANSKKYKEY